MRAEQGRVVATGESSGYRWRRRGGKNKDTPTHGHFVLSSVFARIKIPSRTGNDRNLRSRGKIAEIGDGELFPLDLLNLEDHGKTKLVVFLGVIH